MARRRSARIASGASKVRKSQSASHSATQPPSLESVTERDEREENQGHVPSNNTGRQTTASSPPPRTPASSSPIKPPMSEMHPSKVHPTTAPPSSALRLGFTDIQPSPHGPNGSSAMARGVGDAAIHRLVASTPSKATLPSSPFTFRFTRKAAVDNGLSDRAQQMMDELREEAQRIKAELVAKQERDRLEVGQDGEEDQGQGGRKIARAKGKAGRYSAVHMAEFKKMDSIENHPSAFRARPGEFAPLTRGVKRTQSKANMGDPEPVRVAVGKASATASAGATVAVSARTPVSPTKKPNLLVDLDPPSAVKRLRQRLDDDASSSRPGSRDGSSIPRPTTAGKDSGVSGLPRSHTATNLASLMTPTKASLAKASTVKTQASGSLSQSFSKPTITGGGLKKSATMGNLATDQKPSAPVRTPGRFDRVKSILRGHRYGEAKTKSSSALPMPSAPPVPSVPSMPAAAKTPSMFGLNKPLPTVPATTPSRKLVKRVVFTPDAKKTTVAQSSPSPMKSGLSGIPRSRTVANLADLAEVNYPCLDTVMAEGNNSNGADVRYPDLTRRRSSRSSDKALVFEQATAAPPTTPGTFSFRSDHTIRFGSASPTGFGSSRGQASVRHVRPSILPGVTTARGSSIPPHMPGSFPASVADFSAGGIGGGCFGSMDVNNKENKDPVYLFSPKPPIKHGLENKKRHRPGRDEEDEEDEELEKEAARRAAKKVRREHHVVPEGDALLATRLATPLRTPKKPSMTPGVGSRTPSPSKKKATLSLSRLNMLARPKQRK